MLFVNIPKTNINSIDSWTHCCTCLYRWRKDSTSASQERSELLLRIRRELPHNRLSCIAATYPRVRLGPFRAHWNNRTNGLFV